MLIEEQENELSHSSTNTDSNSYWLTTKDNPFNPFTQFEEWLQFDSINQYNSSGLLARIAKTSNDLSEKENDTEIHRAMTWIVAQDPMGVYKIVRPSDFK